MQGYAGLAVILLAAGEGRRFGGRKLEAELDGKMLGLHAAELFAGMRFGATIAVCNPDQPRLNSALGRRGFQIIVNSDPSAGQGQSLALGALALDGGGAKGALVALGDMPFLTCSHVERLVATYSANDEATIVCSKRGDIRLPPAIFPCADWSRLAHLSGDQGAKALIANAQTVAGDRHMLSDIDRPEDLVG